MLEYFKIHSIEEMLNQIDLWIEEYQLNKTNQEGYLKFREYYNNNKNPLILYTLICFAFNNQIRFNSSGNYNMPFGKDRSSFNPTLRNKFIEFVEVLHNKHCDFYDRDFKDLKIDNLSSNDLVYCDPPYLNSTATYNENGGWTIEQENVLRELLIKIHKNNGRFALSNNLTTNTTLQQWAEDNGFIIHDLTNTYSNCNYQKKDKVTKDLEVLITNY